MKTITIAAPGADPKALVGELLRAVPPAGAEFNARERVAWLTGVAALFDVLYGFDPSRPILVVAAEEVADGRRH